MSETLIAWQDRMSDHHFWPPHFWVYLSFFVMYTNSRRSVKWSLIGQITCACNTRRVIKILLTKNWRSFATSHHSIVKNFLIGWKISYPVASVWFYFMFLFLSYLGPWGRERKKSKCGDDPWKIPYLNKENSHSSHSSPWLFHPIWQTSPRRKKIGKQPMKTAPHPTPLKQRSK